MYVLFKKLGKKSYFISLNKTNMKNTKKVLATALMFMFVLSSGMQASAQTNTTADQEITAPAAGLTITAPSSIAFGGFETNATGGSTSATFTAGGTYVTDLRDGPAGFSATVTTSDFISGSNSMAYANLSLQVDDATYPAGAYSAQSSDLTGIVVPAAVLGTAAAFAGAGATSDPTSLLIGDTTQRIGQYNIDPLLNLTVPPFQPTGTYQATLQFTVS
jgi:hypothetical protein